MFDIEKIKSDIKDNMSSKRYEHSLLVAQEAKNLALKYGADENIAYVTGLVHDIAKEFDEEENKRYIEKYNIINNNLKTIHADIGAIVAKEKYNFTDEMAQAIARHTIGGENMSLLDKIILISDKIGRVDLNDNGKELKELAYKDLDCALLKYLRNLVKKLESKNKTPDKVTLQLITQLEKENKLD